MSEVEPDARCGNSNSRNDSGNRITSRLTRLQQGYLPQTSNAILYRWEYLRMIFDYKLWDKEAVAILGSTIASLYATLLVCVYVAFSFMELVTYPKYKEFLEINGFFIFLFLLSDVYFLFILYQVLTAGDDRKPGLVENEKSHGSLTVRIGAIVFGLGTLIYLFLQLLDFFEISQSSPCYAWTQGMNNFLMIFFVFLQAFVIFTFPRLNLLSYKLLNRYGTMHLVATNIILWVRTLIKESLEEVAEVEREHEMIDASMSKAPKMRGHVHGKCNAFIEAIKIAEEIEQECKTFKSDLLGDVIERSTSYLYPFIIEFALIGASVCFIMSNHIGKKPAVPQVVANVVRKPNLPKFLKTKDFSHSLKGFVCGIIVIVIALANLILFMGLDSHEQTEDAAEYLSKISNTVMNLLGIFGLLIGIAEIQQLNFRDPNVIHLHLEMDLDLMLLRFTSIFSFLYMIFTIITGVFNTHAEDFPNELHVVNGVVSIIQISLQIVFIYNLKHKVLPHDKEFSKPGRQITFFLFLFNLAQWFVFTFEIQKVRASIVEAEFYGFMPWVVIRRVTLPLAVFFRFHSAVVFIELHKEVFSLERHSEAKSEPSTATASEVLAEGDA